MSEGTNLNDDTASRASPSMSLHSASSSTSSSLVPLKKRRLNEFKSFSTTEPTTPVQPNQNRMECEKKAAASALAALSVLASPQADDVDEQSQLTHSTRTTKDSVLASCASTPTKQLPPTLSEITDGNASDSDLSSNGSLSSGPLVPMPRAVHAPPVNSMMVDHTYTDYSVLSEDYLALYCGCNEGDGATADGNPSDGGAGVNVNGKRRHAKKMKKLKQIFRNMGQTRKNSGGVVQPFPAKLMEVLDRGDMEESICWMPHGRAFAVLQPPVFVKEVLPRFFKQSKVTSFTRQLNLWGFKRITKGTDAGAYYHELFLRGRPRLCMMMRRQKIKGTGIKLTPNPDTEPNFYTISEDRPLPPPAKKDIVRPLPPLQQQSGVMPHPNGRRGLPQQLNKRGGMRNPHSHILAGPSPAAAAGRFTPQPLGANKSHLQLLSEARKQQQQQHNMQYPFSSQLRGGYNSHPSQTGNSNMSSLIPSRLPGQERTGPSHHSSLLRSMPEAHHSAYHHSLNSPELSQRHQRPSTHYQDRQSRLFQEQRIAAEQIRADREKMHFNAILRERAEEEDQRHRAQAVMSAQELLYQVDGMVPEAQAASPSGSTSVEELKHRLLVAARALEVAQQPGNGAGPTSPESLGGMVHGGGPGLTRRGTAARESLSAMMHGGGMGQMSGGPSAPSAPHQLHHRTTPQHQTQSQRVNFPALMSVLEQTQKVAAAAHEQSAILQKFAQDLNGDAAAGGGGAPGGSGNGVGWRFGNNSSFPHK